MKKQIKNFNDEVIEVGKTYFFHYMDGDINGDEDLRLKTYDYQKLTVTSIPDDDMVNVIFTDGYENTVTKDEIYVDQPMPVNSRN